MLRPYARQQSLRQDRPEDIATARTNLVRWYTEAAAAASQALAGPWAGPALTVGDHGCVLPVVTEVGVQRHPQSWLDANLAAMCVLTKESARHDRPKSWMLAVHYLLYLYIARYRAAQLERLHRITARVWETLSELLARAILVVCRAALGDE